VKAPLLANMTEFGKTPYLSAREFQELGYRVVIFPVTALRVALKAVLDFYAELRESGTQEGYLEKMLTRDQYYDLIGYAQWHEYEKRFVG
jgi:methylisocitrate lyase